MRSRLQLKHVTEFMKYLEEQIQLIEPVIWIMQNAKEKSKMWIDDKNDNPSITYSELCQELDSATTAMLGAALHIISENKEPLDVDAATPSFYQSTPQTTTTEKRDWSESTNQVTKQGQQTDEILSRLEQIETAISSLQDVSRLEQIETAISSLQDVSRLEQIETAVSSLQDVSRLEQIETAVSSLQDANDKSTNDISEIEQWRDNFVTEQSDMRVNIEQLSKKQKQNFKNFRKQMSEQDNKVKELNKEIESLKEKESKSNKTLETLSLNMKEYENNLHKINKEFQDYTDKIDSITQEIKRHSNLMAALQEECDKILCNTSTQIEKHNVVYKLLQQRLMPIDKLIQIFNQNLETREEKITKLETIEATISLLSKDLNLLESRVCNRYACYMELAYPTPVSVGSIISTFSKVREYNGQHFNQTNGKFVSPHDGLYLVCVTLNESEDKRIRVGARAGDRWLMSIEVKCAATSAAGSVVVDMKKGQELYFQVSHADQGSKLSWFSSFNIVSL
ncbi:chromosome partition protein Smc-like [Physella acuta]|uniref:chromosome partition protein Smc-like n=1 Tax=Physella acuta TaxID=109671 RepID=UPI0027DE1849|nr:chromosome partition protein Smc-like [Physella acuta]